MNRSRTTISALSLGVVLLIGVIGTAGAISAVSPARADSAPRTGVFAVDCHRTVRRSVDPIKPIGMTAMSHLHDFFGVRRVTADSRPSDLLTGRTSCSLKQDHSAYWMPTLFNHGRAQAGDPVQAYYFLPPNVVAMPRGLVMVAGDMRRTDGTNPQWSSWSCQPSSDYRQPLPPACPSTGWITMEIDFPSCWDGRALDSSDHRSHMAYPTEDVCPATHPVQVPRLVLFRNVNQYAGPLDDISLSSGSAASLHADVVSGWDPQVFDRLIRACAGRDCGHLTRMPKDPARS